MSARGRAAGPARAEETSTGEAGTGGEISTAGDKPGPGEKPGERLRLQSILVGRVSSEVSFYTHSGHRGHADHRGAQRVNLHRRPLPSTRVRGERRHRGHCLAPLARGAPRRPPGGGLQDRVPSARRQWELLQRARLPGLRRRRTQLRPLPEERHPARRLLLGATTRGAAHTVRLFSRVTLTHYSATVLINRDTLMAVVADAIIEDGDLQRHPDVRGVANTIPVGASLLHQANAARLNERPLEQLPLSRYRFAVTGRVAHRFSASTLRLRSCTADTASPPLRPTSDRSRRGAARVVLVHARLHLQTRLRRAAPGNVPTPHLLRPHRRRWDEHPTAAVPSRRPHAEPRRGRCQ